MHIDGSFFWDVKTETISFVRDFDLSKLFCDGCRKCVQSFLHLISTVLSGKEMVQGRERIIQMDIFSKKTEFRLFFLDDVDQISFKFIVAHVGKPPLYKMD